MTSISNSKRKYHKQNINLPLCPKCGYLKSSCMCNLINEKIKLMTKITLLIHYKEYIRITNTGKLIKVVLENYDIIKIGEKDNPLEKNIDKIILKDYANIILFPTASLNLKKYLTNKKKNSSISEKKTNQNINIIIPDGTWKQASKIIRKNHDLAQLIKVKLPLNEEKVLIGSDLNSLRKNLSPDRKSTFEAIIGALHIIENNSDLKKSMIELYHNFVSMMKS